MLVSFTTTQNATGLFVGATEVFGAIGILKDGVPWLLTGGSATLTLTSPSGSITTLNATISSNSVTVGWTVPNAPGRWFREWTFSDSVSFVQLTGMCQFTVAN
jgi:hypothetical protein